MKKTINCSLNGFEPTRFFTRVHGWKYDLFNLYKDLFICICSGQRPTGGKIGECYPVLHAYMYVVQMIVTLILMIFYHNPKNRMTDYIIKTYQSNCTMMHAVISYQVLSA
jgi:hypothetical protein